MVEVTQTSGAGACRWGDRLDSNPRPPQRRIPHESASSWQTWASPRGGRGVWALRPRSPPERYLAPSPAGRPECWRISSQLLASSVLSRSGSPYVILTGRGHVARQGSYPLQPGAQRREALEVVAALRTEARVHI